MLDYGANDIQMMNLQEHLLMSVDNPKLQCLVSKLLQPLSTCHQIIWVKEFSRM